MAAQVVMAAAKSGGAAGAVSDATHAVVGIAEAAAQIQDIVQQQAAKNKEIMRNENNEFNIRKNFLDNAVNAVKEATFSQFNIVICTDQEHDDFQNLEGRILPMELLNLEIAPGKNINFEVYVFDTGKYLRHGKWERNYWNWWGNNKQWHDPAAMHVHFEVAQKKLDPAQIKAQQDADDQKKKQAADATAAAQAAQTAEAASNAAAIQKEAQAKAQAAQQGQYQQTGAPSGADPYGSGYQQTIPQSGYAGSPYGSADPYGAAAAPGATTPAGPSFTQQMMGAFTGPAMSMMMGQG